MREVVNDLKEKVLEEEKLTEISGGISVIEPPQPSKGDLDTGSKKPGNGKKVKKW